MPANKKVQTKKQKKGSAKGKKSLAQPKPMQKQRQDSAKDLKKQTAKKLSAEVYNISGKKEGTISLPKEIFGLKPNDSLLAQAIHVYTTNQTAHWGSTKTRSQTKGGGAKPWRQKGTGRARAGSTRSPLWVGGAKALGPKPRKAIKKLTKKMKKTAFISALSKRGEASEIKIVSNIEKVEPKTKIMANFLTKTNSLGSNLFVISEPNKNVRLSLGNIKGTNYEVASNLNVLDIIKSKNIFISKEALEKLKERIQK